MRFYINFNFIHFFTTPLPPSLPPSLPTLRVAESDRSPRGEEAEVPEEEEEKKRDEAPPTADEKAVGMEPALGREGGREGRRQEGDVSYS